MDLKYKLLDHPFYQSWSEGKVSIPKLSEYGQSYVELITFMPDLWRSIITDLNIKNETSERIIEDETRHISLWTKWIEKLPKAENSPSLKYIIDEISLLSPSARLGALQSFEMQQPEVAKTKKEGLIKHYGFDPADLEYFDEHLNEIHHINFGLNLANTVCDKKEFEFGLNKGSELFYHSLDVFVEA
ncbi:MAG: hypothetical protein N2319_13435 [Candidatus Kapabacteria bacterium]|nr:hypothetical protein [Candidatus Kapabacteria bacterium]